MCQACCCCLIHAEHEDQSWLDRFTDLVDKNCQAVWRNRMLKKAQDLRRYICELQTWRDQLESDIKMFKHMSGMSNSVLDKPETAQEQDIKLTQAIQQSGIPFHIEAISSHVMQELHPCGLLLQEFKNAFLMKNRHLLFIECRNPIDGSPAPESELLTRPEDGLIGREVSQDKLKEEAARCINELKMFISIFYHTIVAFY